MNTPISRQAADARDKARADNGTFTKQTHLQPEASVVADLTKPALPDVELRVILQRWDDRDETINVGHTSFDAKAVLDSMSVDDIEADEFGESIFIAASSARLTAYYEGPTNVNVRGASMRMYLEARRAGGLLEPVTATIRPRDIRDIEADITAMAARRQQVKIDEHELAKEGLAATIIKRLPSATEATIYNSLAEHDGLLYSVGVIRGPEGVLWTGAPEEDKFRITMTEYSMDLDRFGFKHIEQEPDENHDNTWYGIKF